MNHPAAVFAHEGPFALTNENGDPLPHLTPAERSLNLIVRVIEIEGKVLTSEQIECLVSMLKLQRTDAITQEHINRSMGVERRKPKRHKTRHPIRKAVRAAVVAIQARMLGKTPITEPMDPGIHWFKHEMEGIQDRAALTRLERRAYLWSWLSRGMGIVVFFFLGILAFLYQSEAVHWTSRAIVLLSALTAVVISDKMMLDAFRFYGRRERHYLLACLRRAQNADQIEAAGFFVQPPHRGVSDVAASSQQVAAEKLAFSDKLYRNLNF